MSAGHHLLFFSIAVTGLAIILAFGATGYWIEGTVAAIGGGLSSAFLMRSSIGRVDTDQLNLGFIYLLFALVMLRTCPLSKAHTSCSNGSWFHRPHHAVVV